jgi:hypothetical protein
LKIIFKLNLINNKRGKIIFIIYKIWWIKNAYDFLIVNFKDNWLYDQVHLKVNIDWDQKLFTFPTNSLLILFQQLNHFKYLVFRRIQFFIMEMGSLLLLIGVYKKCLLFVHSYNFKLAIIVN